MSNFKLNFVGIGAAKAGTTWLMACLAEHPEVCKPRQKELIYFCRSYLWWQPTVTYHDLGPPWLERQFSHRQPGQLCGEMTPVYMPDVDAPRLLYEHNPAIKLIVALRNPVEGLHALYYELLKRKPVPDTFEAYLERYPEVLNYGHFYSHLQRFLAYFPLSQYHFIWYDDVCEHPEAVLRQLFQFLGVDVHFTPQVLHQRINPRQTARVTAVRNVVSFTTDRLNASNRARRVKNVLRALGVHRMADAITAANFRSVARGPMQASTQQRLIALYRDENDQLARLLGRDLSHWNR